MVDKSRETKVIWHAVCGVVFLIFTVPVYIYYIYNRKTFNLHPRAGMLSLLSGLYSIVACLAVFCRGFSKSHEDDTLSCNILHTIGFLFPSCFVAPFICRALKVVVQWDDIESMKRFVSVKFSMGMIVVTSVLYWLIGALVLVSPNTEKMLDGKECVVFDYWVYFTSFYSVILLVTFPLLLKLRNIKDKFFISRELKIQFLLLTVFIFTYVLIVIFISCDVITKENASYNLHLNYYLVVLCSASFYVSFLDPFRSGFRRSDDESDTSPSDSKNNMLTALNPLHIDIKMEDLMSMPLEEVIQSDGLYEVLRRVSKRALCLELLHFVLACRMYTHKNNANIVPTVSSFDISPKHTSKVSKPRRTASFAETYFPSMKKYSADDELNTSEMGAKEATFVRDQYSSYLHIIDGFVKTGSVGEVNISNQCRSATLALASPASFSDASVIARAVVFDRAMEEVEAVIRSNLFPDMLMYIEENKNKIIMTNTPTV